MKKQSKIRFRAEVWGRTILFQVLEMDERFRRKDGNRQNEFIAKNGIEIYSTSSVKTVNHEIYLRGDCAICDYDVGKLLRDTEQEAQEYHAKLIEAIKDWAENWEGWKEEETVEKTENGVYEF